jgi:hypothetical protein
MHGPGSTSTTAGPTDRRTRQIELFLRFVIASDYDVISGAI